MDIGHLSFLKGEVHHSYHYRPFIQWSLIFKLQTQTLLEIQIQYD